ncbi:MAG: hypothetical protein L3J82_07695 [Planctomycetes bacterium]|nr:hypothetical protein [Planctomycetota bacterium]
MRSTTTEIAGLTTRVVDNLPDDTKPTLLVVLCHGFGAPGDDLVAIGQEVLAKSKALSKSTIFYFPQGPIDLSSIGMYGSRAWWELDIEAINLAMQTGGFRERARDDIPDGLIERRAERLDDHLPRCGPSRIGPIALEGDVRGDRTGLFFDDDGSHGGL